MKNRFTTLDIAYLIYDLRQKLLGLRVDQIYDIDKKTYLIRFVKSGTKKVLLMESGTRFHTTQFDWPKNPAPSGFSMKMRKHLNNKRLEKIELVGADRIVHLQFGIDTAAYHLFLELYDKGNIILTDHTFTILNLVRPRIIGEERMAAHEKYDLEKAKQDFCLDNTTIEEVLRSGPTGSLRDVFLSKLEFGPTLFTHVLSTVDLVPQMKIAELVASEERIQSTLVKLGTAFEAGKNILENVNQSGGFIVLAKQDSKKAVEEKTMLPKPDEPLFYDQFHPSVIRQCFGENVVEFENFDEAVDEFFSKVESQKLDMKQLSQEKEAIKKLEKVKLDQHKRLRELQEGQETDKQKAELITVNLDSVDMAISAIRKLVASQVPWSTIEEQLQEARSAGDRLASMISKLNLKQNKITLILSNPYDADQKPLNIDVDLNLSAYANASKYFDLKKASAKKEERTFESQGKALKSTEKKTKALLKEAATIHSIKKARKVLWFEKFRWFITSENYLVLGGRDAQQNELLVKRYLRPKDVYMHADAHGAPTVIIKNDILEYIPPKTLNESGVFAVASSGSWESKVVTSSWWVWGDQVSKSAPSGEYLPTGSFMIRGKKNYMPPCQLVLGFGFLFRLTEDSVEAHRNERPRKTFGDSSEQEIPTENDTDENDEEQFPDTHVSLNVDGDKVRTRLTSTTSAGEPNEEPGEFLVTTVLPSTVNTSVQKLKNKQKKATKSGKNQPKVEEKPVVDDSSEFNSAVPRPKRGQHGRNKKLKEKYKFQDDEERQLRMQLLRVGQVAEMTNSEPSAATVKSDVSVSDDDDDDEDTLDTAELSQGNSSKLTENVKVDTLNAEAAVEEEETDEIQELEGHETELDILKSLTGSPLEQDELLYAVPVVAPYATLQNYKFRIKMTPGTSKRGKAAKAALESFLRDKEANTREKDLIKAVKDQDLARNFPGKVKLSNIIRDKK